jgi:hypothetical protein
MLATRPPKQPGNHHPTMSSNIMAISVGTSSEEPAPTGVLYILNALAFSTLLSSQETDAHRCEAYRSTSGQPLNLTLVFPSCQLHLSGRFRKDAEAVRRIHQTPDVTLRGLAGLLRAHAKPGKEAPGGSPGPGPPSGVPSPSGQDELYGCRAAQSNRELYPVGIPVLTCPNKFDTGEVPCAS